LPPQNKKSGSEGLGSEDIKKEYLQHSAIMDISAVKKH
jgi:hypothetical protein